MLFKMTIIMVSRNKYILYSKIYDKNNTIGRGINRFIIQCIIQYNTWLEKALKIIAIWQEYSNF